MSNYVEYKADYMIAVHRAPDDYPEEQEFVVVKGCIDKQYALEGWSGDRKLQETILDDIKEEFVDKVEKEHWGHI